MYIIYMYIILIVYTYIVKILFLCGILMEFIWIVYLKISLHNDSTLLGIKWQLHIFSFVLKRRATSVLKMYTMLVDKLVLITCVCTLNKYYTFVYIFSYKIEYV